MALKLYFHPLASFCHKVLIALYENTLPFDPVIVDLGNETSREAFRQVWPPLKFPVLVDEARQAIVAESATVIDYLDSFATPERPLYPAIRISPGEPACGTACSTICCNCRCRRSY